MGKDFLLPVGGACPPGYVPDPVSGLCVLAPPTGGGGTVDLSGVITQLMNLNALMRQLLSEWQLQFDIPTTSPLGSVNGYVDFNPNGTVGTTAIQLYLQPKKVRTAIIQNLSTTDNYTITSSGSPSRPAAVSAAGKGPILNKASATGLGGGTLKVGNIDLSALSVISDTNTGQNIVVYYEL